MPRTDLLGTFRLPLLTCGISRRNSIQLFVTRPLSETISITKSRTSPSHTHYHNFVESRNLTEIALGACDAPKKWCSHEHRAAPKSRKSHSNRKVARYKAQFSRIS